MSDCDIPELVELSTYDGNYAAYEEAVYNAFCDTFQNRSFSFHGLDIGHKKHPEYKGKSATFWHIISSGTDEKNRIPDLRRYERIKWPSYILLNCCSNECDKILIWKNIRNHKNRTLIFCIKYDYLIVLDERDGYYVFWTAYPVDYPNRRERLIKEYTEYMAKTAQPIG